MTNRRSFLRWGFFGLILSRIFARHSSALAQNNSPAGFTPVGTVQELDSKGFLLNEDLEIGAVLVKRKKDQSIMALDPTCTHMGCIVEWNGKQNAFICPCHDSKFKQDGTRIEGLAPSNLTQYQVKIQNKTIFVGKK